MNLQSSFFFAAQFESELDISRSRFRVIESIESKERVRNILINNFIFIRLVWLYKSVYIGRVSVSFTFFELAIKCDIEVLLNISSIAGLLQF